MHKKGTNFRGLYYYSWWKTHFLGKKNILIAYYAMEICYFNFEDIVLISEWLVYENIFTSFYILKYKFQTHTLDKNSKPLVLCVIKSIASLRHVLMEYGVRVTLYRVVFLLDSCIHACILSTKNKSHIHTKKGVKVLHQ